MSENKAVQRFFAHILMAVGGLIAVLCGGCTVVLLGWAAWFTLMGWHQAPLYLRGNYTNAGIGLAMTSTIVGGLPTCLGALIFFSGLRMKRRAEGPPPRDADKTRPHND